MRPVPGEATDEETLMARAAWLYYVGGLNQEEAARRLGITRARVNKLLADARHGDVDARLLRGCAASCGGHARYCRRPECALVGLRRVRQRSQRERCHVIVIASATAAHALTSCLCT